MKKISILIIVLFTLLGVYIWSSNSLNNRKVGQLQKKAATPTPSAKQDYNPKSFLFVPYWATDISLEDQRKYDSLYYFALSPGSNGSLLADEGMSKLEDFTSVASGQETYLVIKMTDSETAQTIISDSDSVARLIEETSSIVNKYKFKGIALDLEISNFLDSSLTGKINSFVQVFYNKLQDNNVNLHLIIYGDVFYRHRPYDVSYLARNSDLILVMAYDFHKSIGEPGPNFPLSRGSKYGYDFQQMTDDFLAVVPSEQLGVIFGMYGYDWSVDEQKRPLNRARALSLKDIRESFIDNCSWKNCTVKRDPLSAETEVNYVDSAYHIVWFEDEGSTQVKKQYLKERGVGLTGYWVWGYF